MATDPVFPKVLTMRQLALAMGWNYCTVRHMHASGRLPGARKVLGSVRIVQEDFLKATGLRTFPVEVRKEADVS